MTIAVAGCDGAGKTTFITSALDMRQPFKGRQTTKKMSLDGSVYLVRVLELSTTEITPDPKGPVWPRFGSDLSPPTIDGVLVLHDITQPSTFPETAKLLGASLLPLSVYSGRVLHIVHRLSQQRVMWLIDGSFCLRRFRGCLLTSVCSACQQERRCSNS